MSYSSFLRKHNISTFSFSPIDVKTVTNIVRNSKPKTSKGTDGISIKLLIKLIIHIIALPPTILINQFMTGMIPKIIQNS